MQIIYFLSSFVVFAKAQGTWDRFYTLRDDTNTWPNEKPFQGWYVTGIHQNLLPSGNVLVTGWGRQSLNSCVNGNGGQAATSRRFGVSFVLDPQDITESSNLGKTTYNVNPLNENGERHDDVLYCSGHTTLPDSTKFFFGGSTYENLGQGPAEKEYGLDYARVFDEATKSFTRIPHKAPFGTSWYPTTMMLPDQRILVARGFSRCCGGEQSAEIATFNYEMYKNGKVNPWQLILDESQSRPDIKPGIKDYTRVWVLPEPVFAGGIERQVAMMGANGFISLFNTDRYRPTSERFFGKSNGQRYDNCGWDTTGAILSTGELMVAGGCRPNIDLYNPKTDSWRSIYTEITRHTSSSVLLPNGNVLLIDGENPNINQDNGQGWGGDPRIPQIFDPYTGNLEWCSSEPADGNNNNQATFRGYHNSVLLLMDGRILVSGGVSKNNDIGCEESNLRIFNPPYLTRGPRPEIRSLNTNEMHLDSSDFIEIDFSGDLRESSDINRSGAVLMAFGAFTHSYDQNQRYVPLRYEYASGKVRVFAPKQPRAIPGDYVLYLVSKDGVPSVGRHVTIKPTLGKWLRTVLFINKETSGGQDLFVRGGHDGTVEDKYNGKSSETIVYANNIGLWDEHQADVTLDWGSNSALAWTASPGSSSYHDDNKIYYATTGAGTDPENTYGRHWWKFEVYTKIDEDAQDNFGEWFEFKAFLRHSDGRQEWESNIDHNTVNGGPQPPATTINHWAKKGSVTKVVFGESNAEIYDLNERGVADAELPYQPSSVNSNSFLPFGIGIGSGLLLVSGGLFARKRRGLGGGEEEVVEKEEKELEQLSVDVERSGAPRLSL